MAFKNILCPPPINTLLQYRLRKVSWLDQFAAAQVSKHAGRYIKASSLVRNLFNFLCAAHVWNHVMQNEET
jgi:hypothetical protein